MQVREGMSSVVLAVGPGHTLREIRRFFEDYKTLEHKQVIVEDLLGVEDAIRIIRESLDLYRQLRRGELRRV